MKKIIILINALFCLAPLFAQDDVYPAKESKGLIFITNATIHVGNGQVISNGTVKINNGKIEQVGAGIAATGDNAKVVDAKGKHVYPGLILSNSDLGLREIASGVRASNDFQEIGDFNPNIRSIVAYNSDSRIIGTLRTNGILLVNVAPQGGLITGTSSVVQLDAWNWEDAAYKMENAMHFNMPTLITRQSRFAAFLGLGQPSGDPVRQALDRIESVKSFFREAKSYLAESTHDEVNLQYESVKGLFAKTQKLFVHCDLVKQMLIAVDFAKEFGFDVVIVGGSESWQIADLLKQSNIAVILSQEHSLPTTEDDDVDQPYKTPAALQKAGVLFALNDDDQNTRSRNLAFNAGTAAAYGLTKEEALTAITLNAAKILGIADKTGSLEAGKDANIVISEGDILDMKTSIITNAFIQGREINLTDKHKQLYDRYQHKYGIGK
ncbi:MAG: amidohydrolase family protein [Gemmatimonadaceae bacterium]|nr:amidohydrolase family protein [Chitinophagaceae bacterium]